MFKPIDLFIRECATWLWGFPMLAFLSIVGGYFTLRLKGLQFRRFTTSARLCYLYRTGAGEGNISPLQSLLSALGGVIGNGNLGGVATAIAVGGPGAVFGLWIASLVAMILVYVEAGTGSSPIMYSTARTQVPDNLALIGMFGVVIDTLVGTLTAFVILATGVWTTGQTSTALTTAGFDTIFGSSGAYFIFTTSFLFGYSTLVAWSFYGEQCFAYIWGPGIRKTYRWLFCFAICFGFLEAEFLWSWGDLLNGITVLVNLIAVTMLIRHVDSSTL